MISLQAYEILNSFQFVFLILFSPFNSEKNWKDRLCEMPVITQSLNINNLRTTSAKYINLISLESLFNIRWKLLK